MRDNGSKQSTRHTGRNIWIVVLILVIILIITLALMGGFLSGLSGKEGNIIPLFSGESREDGAGSIRKGDSPELVIEDGQASWEVDTSVDLFKAAYANAQGEITAKSADGEKIIAPGTANSYEFSLKNTGNISLDYTMKLDSMFALTNQELPMQIRLHSGDRWLLGGANDWAKPEDLTSVTETGTLEVNQYVIYAFEWQWPFESGADDTLLGDLNDTLIGNAAVEQDVMFQLNIGVQSTVTPGAMGDGIREEEPRNILNRTVLLALLILGLGFLLLLVLLLWRRPVYVTGFLHGTGELCLGRRKDTLRLDGRFLFPRIYMGRHSLTLGETQRRIRLQRRRELQGIAFESQDDLLVITIGKKVRAVELYLLPTLTVRQEEWAAIDKDHNVITPEGVQEPDENKENTTPGGLHIGKDGKLDIEPIAAAT